MKTIITLLMASCCIAVAAENEPAFQAREFSVDSFYQLKLDDRGHLDRMKGDGIGVGVSYYLTENIGGAVSVLADEHTGTPVDALSAGLRLRYPIGQVAPYALIDLRYDFRNDDTSYLLGGGVEWRPLDRWGLFGEAGYDLDSRSGDDIVARLGVRFRF